MRGRAQAYIDAKRYPQAMRDLDRLLQLEPGQAITHADRGLALMQAGRLAQAGKAFDIAIERGVKVALGTDCGVGWHGTNAREIGLLVESGMTPMQVIVAATRNSAEFLRLADAGTLQAGKSADFIVLDANPLDDITNTRRIAAVILRGTAVDRAHPVQ